MRCSTARLDLIAATPELVRLDCEDPHALARRCEARLPGQGPPANGTVEVGYSVIEPYPRRGLATEAVAELMEWAFWHPEVLVIHAETYPDLLPSVRVLQKLGFTKQGPGTDPGTIRLAVDRVRFCALHGVAPTGSG